MYTPTKIGDLEVKNRFALAPLTRGRCGFDRVPKAHVTEYYQQRSTAGLIIAEATNISQQAQGFAGAPGIYNDDQVKGWKHVADGIHEKGSVFFLQLWHMGRAAHSCFSGSTPVAPSAIAIEGHTHNDKGEHTPYELPRALETDEIPGIVEDYRKAAANAKAAGIDGVEIHAANGYLLNTFLESSTNTRTDKYGGSLENRFRIVREVIDAILTVYPANRIGIRISPNGIYNSMGSEDNFVSFLYYLQELAKYNLGYVHIMDGLAFGYHNKCTPVTLADVRKVYKGTLIANCGYTYEAAEEAIKSGNADLVAFGRPYIANPDLPERYKNNWPLAECGYDVWYGNPASDDQTTGYTSFPTYQA